jgi:phosphate transport system permease protein
VSIVVLILCILLTLVAQSMPVIQKTWLYFFTSDEWDPVKNNYGALPFLSGTLLTSFLALLLSIPFSFAVAIFLGEYFPKGWMASVLRTAVELIAAVPSVIYGFWGLTVLVPFMRQLQQNFGIRPIGYGIFTSALVLAVMIIPYSASLGRSMITMVPQALKEAAYSLGATRWEVIKSVILPYTRSGLFAGVLLSLGRALGETMAVTMVIGNTAKMPDGIFSTGNTLASVIANELGEADKRLYNAALIELGLVLFIVTFIINVIGRKVMKSLSM